MVVMILQLSYLSVALVCGMQHPGAHAESIRGVWLKANAPGPLGDRLSCFEFVYHRDWTSICMRL